MNIRTLLTIPAFAIAFSLAFLAVTVIPNKKISFFFTGQNDLQAQAKIYNFLQKDWQIRCEMVEKMNLVEQRQRLFVMKETFELRDKLDTTDLPKDFRYVWEKKVFSDLEWINFMLHLRNVNGDGSIISDAQKEISSQKIDENKSLEEELNSVAESYGVDLKTIGIRKS